LTRHVLLQSLNDDFPFREDLDAGRFKRLAGGGSVSEKEMSDALASNDPGSSAFDAHTGTSQSLSHVSETPRAIVKRDR
jgi:hypothetical protein